jgi:hypothetical protein
MTESPKSKLWWFAGLLVRLAIILVLGCFVAWRLAAIWIIKVTSPPLPPLNHSHKEVRLANGGFITIEGYERRSWRGNNVDFYASYRPPGQTNEEVFGSWSNGGADIPALVFFAGKLVVVQNPDHWALHVRTSEGRWKNIEMRFPRLSDASLSFFTNATSLSESDLQRIRDDGGTNHPDWFPSAWIDRFDPDTRILSVNYMFWKDLTFELAEDGSTLHLINIRLRKGQ